MDKKIIIMLVVVIVCCCCCCCLSLSATSTAIVMAGGDTCEDYCDKDGTDTCEEDSDEEEDDDKYTCTCNAGYGGNKCEELVCDSAAKADCNETGTTKQGTCIVSEPNAETYTCECERGYSGEKCSTALALKNTSTCTGKCANESDCVGDLTEVLTTSVLCGAGQRQCTDATGTQLDITDQTACLAPKHTWTAGSCSDGTSEETACETASVNTWTAGSCSSGSDSGPCEAAGETWTPAACSDPSLTTEAECLVPKHTWTAGSCSDGSSTEAICETVSMNVWDDSAAAYSWSPAGYCKSSTGTRTSDVNISTCEGRAGHVWRPSSKTVQKTGLSGYCSGSTCTIDECCTTPPSSSR